MNRACLRAKLLAFASAASSLPPVYLTAEDESVSLAGPELPAAVGVDQPGLNFAESDCGGDGDLGNRTPVPDEDEASEEPAFSLTADVEETESSAQPLTPE